MHTGDARRSHAIYSIGDEDLIDGYRVFLDLAPVFAQHQRARCSGDSADNVIEWKFVGPQADLTAGSQYHRAQHEGGGERGPAARRCRAGRFLRRR